jgi:hypothetical protein
MADTKISALTSLSVPALDDVLAAVDVSGGPDSVKLLVNYLIAMGGTPPGGRLTVSTGVPVTTSDVTGAGTLYYAPYLNNRICIYDGTRWRLYNFSQISLSLTITSGSNYDVFVYDNSGTLTLELSNAWTNATTRADALTTQDGVVVKSGATTRLWLGAIRASGSNITEDSKAKRFVANAYNKVQRRLYVTDTTASWTYSGGIRQANANSANKVEVLSLTGNLAPSFLDLFLGCTAVTGGASYGSVGIGEDSTSAYAPTDYIGVQAGQSSAASAIWAKIAIQAPLGYHAYNWLEQTNGNNVDFQSQNSGIRQGGLVGSIMG